MRMNRSNRSGKPGTARAFADNSAGSSKRLVKVASIVVMVGHYAPDLCPSTLALVVQLEGDAAGDAFGWCFEDDDFDLMPGETKIVSILGMAGVL